MRKSDKGSIEWEATVWCGCCDQWDYLDGHSQRDAQHAARKRGWRQSKRLGWLCPSCEKTQDLTARSSETPDGDADADDEGFDAR